MTDALDRLRRSLDTNIGQSLLRIQPADLRKIERQISKLEEIASSGSRKAPLNVVEGAVKRFIAEGRLTPFRDIYLACHGILIPSGSQQRPLIEATARFQTLLDRVNDYLDEPRRFRRCYRGLLHAYLEYDPHDQKNPEVGRQNWLRLRQYLAECVDKVLSNAQNPRWAECLQEHRNVLSSDPCIRYGKDLLDGKTAEIDALRQDLGIQSNSWFMRELYLAQVRAILDKPDSEYLERLHRLTEILAGNQMIADEGLALSLDRHAAMNAPPISAPLRELAVQRWGSPWLPGNSMPWARVQDCSMKMVADWLKLEFIRDFFTLLAENKQGDMRRMKFWQRYVSAIDQIHFALGADALKNSSRDYVALRKRMKGLTIPLQDQIAGNNAFIMRMGALIVVEFSGYSNACYGYKTSRALPFKLDGTPLTTPKDERNSLKHSRRDLWLPHHDGIKDFETWEERFESELTKHGIHPAKSSPINTPSGSHKSVPEKTPAQRSEVRKKSKSETPTEADSPLYSREILKRFAEREGLEIVDRTREGGALWVRVDDSNTHINQTLKRWGFRYKDAQKGWWKTW